MFANRKMGVKWASLKRSLGKVNFRTIAVNFMSFSKVVKGVFLK